ncbi:MAG: mycothiol system anti-sigma-R factor [Acidimicrobiales bacterium]
MVNKGKKQSSDSSGRGPEIVNCREALAKLYGFLDGDMTDQRRAAVKRHLDGCSPCVRAYGFEAELKKMLASKCKDRVPGPLADRIYRALVEEEGKVADDTEK